MVRSERLQEPDAADFDPRWEPACHRSGPVMKCDPPVLLPQRQSILAFYTRPVSLRVTASEIADPPTPTYT